MTKNKSVNFTFFKNAQEESNSSPVQIQITLPEGVNVSIKVEKTLPDGKKLAEQDQATTVQYTSEPEIPQNKNDDPVLVPALIEAKKTSPRWPRPSFQLPEKIRNWLGSEKEWMKYLPETLFGVSILIYLLVRLIGLTDYPGYFNFDEADKTVLASDFLRDGFRNYGGELFPAFFPNPGNNYNVGSSAVYLQIVPMLIFGRSDYVIRATSVLLGLIGAICVSLALRNIFRTRYWWAGILVLSVIPAWFHHSRTGYEMPTFVSFYSAMLYCYWMYRFRKPIYLYPAVLFSALAFYNYSPGQALIPLTIIALLVLDFSYHLRMRNSTLGAAGLGILCVVPYIRFQISHAGNSAEVLSNVGSYWVQDLPITEKISAFLGKYLFHLSPVYWFTPAYDVTPNDGLLHIMKGYGHLGIWLIPLLAWGLWLLIRRLQQPEYRTLLAALLIAPVAAALVTSPSSITRALVMVIPVALIASIGLDDLLRKAAVLLKVNNPVPFAAALLAVLLFVNSYMLWDVLNNGISWFDNNQANGVQFGASKVFPALKEELKSSPNAHAVISPEWAMIVDLVSRIYMGDKANISFNSIYNYAHSTLPLENDTIFVVTPEEFDFAQKNPKFSDIQILKTIPYSKSKAGFYLIRLKYSPQAKALMAAEEAERRKPISGEVIINGQKVQIVYTRNDGTLIQDAFDGNPASLYRSFEINPAVFDLTFPQEQAFHSVFIIHGSGPINLNIVFYAESGQEVGKYQASFTEHGTEGNTLHLDPPVIASKVSLSVDTPEQNDRGIVYIWDITFK
jgi:hypothetical protein